MTTAAAIIAELRGVSNKKRAIRSASFFKTKKGQYGYGDIFWGVDVPTMRRIALRHAHATPSDITKLLASPVHEQRFIALLILVKQYQTALPVEKQKIYRLYVRLIKQVNNWDLVDVSAPYIIGDFLLSQSKTPLYQHIRSGDLWQRRIAIVATSAFIRAGEYEDTLRITELLLTDKHDLIHKACGWMLREVGKKDQHVLEQFLRKHCRVMPRTMLRYALERLPAKQRLAYMQGLV